MGLFLFVPRFIQEKPMSADPEKTASPTGKPHLGLSVDVWAVLLAFLLAILVRAGVLQHVPW